MRDSERRIRTITDAMPALIAYVDPDQRFRFVNKPYEDWFNRPREEIDGQPMWVALGAEHYEQRRENVLAALSGNEVTFEMELPAETARSVMRWRPTSRISARPARSWATTR